MRKQWVLALVLFLLVPMILSLGGSALSLINPEIAAGHPNYARNYHVLDMVRMRLFWGSIATVFVLWFVVCSLVIRSRGRSFLWLALALLGPLGFAVLASLNDCAAETDRYSRFVRRMHWVVHGMFETCTFAVVWVLAYQGMLAKRMVIIACEAFRNGMSMAQVIDIQNASSGMWAFIEGNEVMYFVVLLYLLRPIAFDLAEPGVLRLRARWAS